MILTMARAVLAGALCFLYGSVYATDCTDERVTALLETRAVLQHTCLFEFDGAFYFVAQEATTGIELWKSDGTLDGTHLLRDIDPGEANSDPAFLAVVNGRLYFQASEAEHGAELWESDGTEAGTQLIADIAVGPLSSYPLFPTGNGQATVFFSALDAENGRELWAYDTIDRSARLVRDIRPGIANSYPAYLTMLDGRLYFSATDDEHGSEVWVSDGSAEGTMLIDDLTAGPARSSPYYLSAFEHRLYYRTFDAELGTRFFVSDGVPGSTTELAADPEASRAMLSWGAPLTDTDGLPLAGLVGYVIYHWTDVDPVRVRVDIPDAATLSYTFSGLAPGLHYFASTAMGSDGVESELSGTAEKWVR